MISLREVALIHATRGQPSSSHLAATAAASCVLPLPRIPISAVQGSARVKTASKSSSCPCRLTKPAATVGWLPKRVRVGEADGWRVVMLRIAPMSLVVVLSGSRVCAYPRGSRSCSATNCLSAVMSKTACASSSTRPRKVRPRCQSEVWGPAYGHCPTAY